MILRRVIEHVKAQNWTAVALDFCIVVMGVFIGIQVANWSEERNDRKVEHEYLNRLHAELESSIITSREDVNLEAVRLNHLREVGEYLKDESAQALQSEHCLALYRSHIFDREVLSIPAIDELKQVGRVLLISDEALRAAIIEFDQSRIEAADLINNIRIGRLVLSRKYPELIRLDPTDISGEKANCDYPAMRQSQAFINDFSDTLGRFRAYSERSLRLQHEMLNSLHTEIDGVLKVNHEAAPK